MRKLFIILAIFFILPVFPVVAADYTLDAADYGLDIHNYGPDNSQCLQNAVYDLTEGMELIIPPGIYKADGFVFNPPSGCSLKCLGTLLLSQPMVVTGENLRVDGLSAMSMSVHKGPGVILKNLYASKIHIRKCSDFAEGIVLKGDGTGCVYNEIHLGQIVNNKISIRLTASDNGWCNQNCFYGGRLTWWSGSAPYVGYKHIVLDNCKHAINGNTFFSMSLEGGKGYPVTAIDCEGRDNTWFTCRYEMGSERIIRFGLHSRKNRIFWGYGLNWYADVINEGFRNCFFCAYDVRLEGGGNNGVLSICNTSSSYYPSLIIESSDKKPMKTISAVTP